MTASDLARMLGAKEIKRGKEWLARCPSHGDRQPSLSIKPGKRGVVMRCWSHGCTVKEICVALGIRVSDLFYDEKVSREVRARLSLQEQKDSLEHQLDCVIWLQSLEPGKRSYWKAAERRIRRDMFEVRLKLEPVGLWREEQARRLQERIRRVGFEAMWREEYGLDGAGKSIERCASAVRAHSVHGGHGELPPGGSQSREGSSVLHR